MPKLEETLTRFLLIQDRSSCVRGLETLEVPQLNGSIKRVPVCKTFRAITAPSFDSFATEILQYLVLSRRAPRTDTSYRRGCTIQNPRYKVLTYIKDTI